MHQCRPDPVNKETEQQANKRNSRNNFKACEKVTSHTPYTEWSLFRMGRQFSESLQGGPNGMGVVADRQRFQRRMSRRKNMLCLLCNSL